MSASRRYRGDVTERGSIPSLTKVVAIQSFSLLLTIILGMSLFFFGAKPIYYLIAVFLTGPIYSINLFYLLPYLDFVQDVVRGDIGDIYGKIQRYEKRNKISTSLQSKLTTFEYMIRGELMDMSRPLVSKNLLILSFFTPAWPITFYYTLYLITKRMKTFEDMLKEVSPTFSDMGLSLPTPPPQSRFMGRLGITPLFAVVGGISVLGFGLTFTLVGVGFFAIFWTLLLHERLVGYIGGGYRSRKLPMSVVLASLCFGATAGLVASFTNTFYGAVISPVSAVSFSFFLVILVSVVAPLVEETTKVAGFFLLDKKKAKDISLFHWTVLGVLAGLGFALLEDYSYFQRFILRFGTRDSLLLLLMRLSFPVHLLGSGLAALGVGLWRKTNRWFYLILFTALAVIVHASYNFIMTVGGV